MKISQLIDLLQKMQQEHGDLEIYRSGFGMERIALKQVKLEHAAVLRGRETMPRFASWYINDPERVGEPVLRID